MNPIINPWWFYLATRLDNIKNLLILVFVILGIAVVTIGIIWLSELGGSFRDEKASEAQVKLIKRFTVVTIACAALAVFIPSEKTMYTMLALKHLTPNNIEMAGDEVEKAVDYIFEKIDELNEEEE